MFRESFMESLGKKLQAARIEKGLDLDQISRETNIARRYLEDLENERFDDFPGESYLLGFLRNYCEYLDLDGNEFVNAYKNQKIQEMNVPVSELVPTRPFFERLFGRNLGKIKIIAVVLVILASAGFGGFRIYSYFSSRPAPEPEVKEERVPVVHEISGAEFKGRVFSGDKLSVSVGGNSYEVSVAETAPVLKLETPSGTRLVELGQDVSFDVSGDDVPDVKVFVSDLYADDPERGAEILVATGSFPSGQETSAENGDVTVAVNSSDSSKQTVLFEGGSAYPVTLNATFRGYCLFRYEVDRSEREERYYQKSEILTVQAKNGFRVWASNGNAVKLQVIAGGKTVDLDLSRPGEVIVRDLRWLRDDATGRYRFVVMDVD